MKYILFINLQLIFLTSFSQIENENIIFRVNYHYSGTPDTNNLNYKANFYYDLDVNSVKSFFYDPNRLIGDSILYNDKLNADDYSKITNMSKYNRSSATFMAQNEYKINFVKIWDNIGKGFFYIEKKPLQNWNLLPDTMNINGLICNKATTHFRGRDFIAWYTLSYPYPVGPWKFNGLPGLIIKIEDSKKQFLFEATNIIKDKMMGIKMRNPYQLEYQETTYKDIIKFKKWRAEDPQSFLNFLIGGSGTVSISNGQQAFAKRPYNPLEIDD
jgi:GLPGLI family protein